MGETLVKKNEPYEVELWAPTYTVTGGGHILNHQTFQVSKNGGTYLYKLYGYGLCTGVSPPPK